MSWALQDLKQKLLKLDTYIGFKDFSLFECKTSGESNLHANLPSEKNKNNLNKTMLITQ